MYAQTVGLLIDFFGHVHFGWLLNKRLDISTVCKFPYWQLFCLVSQIDCSGNVHFGWLWTMGHKFENLQKKWFLSLMNGSIFVSTLLPQCSAMQSRGVSLIHCFGHVHFGWQWTNDGTSLQWISSNIFNYFASSHYSLHICAVQFFFVGARKCLDYFLPYSWNSSDPWFIFGVCAGGKISIIFDPRFRCLLLRTIIVCNPCVLVFSCWCAAMCEVCNPLIDCIWRMNLGWR